jgi:PAS domain S-box-containing protein
MNNIDDAARLQTLVDTAVDGMILINEEGAVLRVNPACERLFGYGADEMLGQNVSMLMPEPYRSEHDQYLKRYRQTGVPRIIGIGREVQGRRKDGSVFPMHLSVGEKLENGSSVFVGIVHDLSRLKRQEQEAREAAGRLRAVVDTAVDGVILIDNIGTVQMFNPACERLFGYHADEVIGQNVRLLMPEPYRREHDDYLRRYHETGEARIIGIGREVEGRRKDGSTFPMELSVGEISQEDGPGFVGIIHDISERKRTEEQLIQAQKMETVGQLAGGIAHDFNNLLTVIIGNAERLSESLKARPDLRETVDMMLRAGERGADLTQRLLAFSRRQTLQPVETDCRKLIADMEALLRRTLRADIGLRTEPADDLWPVVVDPAQLEASILNLGLNAQDAMPAGGSLTIAAGNLPLEDNYHYMHPEVRPGDYVMLTVTDDGEGMPRETIEHVFEPFFTTKEVGKGSGLGLSMVYGFVKQSGGHVTIYSEPGLGTTVRLYLPAAKGKSTSATEQETEELPESSGFRILVAEDDPFVRAFAIASLESLGYRVGTAVDGHEALNRLGEDGPYDLLFTDIVMPGDINGWELAERAERIQPDIKILLTSGYALEAIAKRGRLPAETAVLNKPYRKSDLIQRVREQLGESNDYH